VFQPAASAPFFNGNDYRKASSTISNGAVNTNIHHAADRVFESATFSKELQSGLRDTNCGSAAPW
jgi:hypothetical protein